MPTETVAQLYARVAEKVAAQTVECPHDAALESRIQRCLATCGKCDNMGRVPDPKYAALRKALWETCTCGICEETNRHPTGCDCRGTGLSDVLRPLDTLGLALPEAIRDVQGVEGRVQVTLAYETAVVGMRHGAYAKAPTLLEALLRALDTALEDKR